MAFFGGGGASVDLASPSAIGSTTPNTGAFTTLSATPPANTTAFTSSGYSLTGTNAQSLFDLSGTWNTSGTPAAFKLNVTDTASNASSLLMDLQVGGTSRASIRKNGRLILWGSSSDAAWIESTAQFRTASIGIGFNTGAGNGLVVASANSAVVYSGMGPDGVFSTGYFGFSTTAASTSDVTIYRDATDILAQRRTTNAQTFRLYNTFTDASNYERGFMRWATNVLEIGAEAAGTGTQRQLRFPLGTVTASTPLSITQTWNSAGVTFTGFQLNATDTASASGSLLMDLQVGGTSRFGISKNGMIIARDSITSTQAIIATGSDGNYSIGYNNGGFFFRINSNIIGGFGLHGSTSILSMSFGSAHFLGWQSGSYGGNTDPDLKIFRDGAGILAQRNSTNAQTFRLYRTFTDASNYERLGFIATRTTRFAIAAENAGTGAARSLEISFYTSASDPASTDITDGCFSVWKNSGTGTIKLWANDGGTMKSVALA